MSLLANSNAIESGGYNIDRSLRFRSSASANLTRTPASTGNQKTWTWSGWVKRGLLSTAAEVVMFGAANSSSTDPSVWIQFNADNTLEADSYTSSYDFRLVTTQVFRDPSAWYHIVVAFDSTQATASNRVKLYVNGSQVTSLSTATYPSLNFNTVVNNTNPHYIGSRNSSIRYFDGYLTEVNFIDGQALTPSSFGQTDAIIGVWVPKKYTGTYGTNGFYLPFSDNTSATTLAYDKSGNGNNWTANNISTTAGATYDSMTDVPTLTSATAANFAVLNPLQPPNSGSTRTLSNGNLNATGTYAEARATIPFPSGGKYYCEVVWTAIGSAGAAASINDPVTNNQLNYYKSAQLYNNGTTTSYGATWTINDIIGIAVNTVDNIVTFYKNGVSQGDVSYSCVGYTYMFIGSGTAGTNTYGANFGQRPFSYTPPTGFKALNTYNLPDPTIKKPNQYMDATTWTGNSSTQTISGLSVQADFWWQKNRANAYDHMLLDTVRGIGNQLKSNTTAAESATTTLTSINSDGFTVNNSNGNNVGSQVAWLWKKGATPGFDIVTYAGTGSATTIAHNLGVAPKMYIIKNRTTAGYSWHVYHAGISATPQNAVIWLESTAAANTAVATWNNTAPTSSVFSVNGGSSYIGVNQTGNNYVAYLFSEIAGFSKFGSYTGNGSTDGPFVYCGFRPKYVLIKNATNGADGYWWIHDTARETYNVADKYLVANGADAEGTSSAFQIDILSNGFKVRGTSNGVNGNGTTLIFAAFAENPFKYSNAR